MVGLFFFNLFLTFFGYFTYTRHTHTHIHTHKTKKNPGNQIDLGYYLPDDLKELVNEYKTIHDYFQLLQYAYGSINESISMSLLISRKVASHFLKKEWSHCNKTSKKYLTNFSPVEGFHVLCFHHYPLYRHSLVIMFQHGYAKSRIPPMRRKNRKVKKKK